MITLSPMSLLFSKVIDRSGDLSVNYLPIVTARTTSKLFRIGSLTGLRSGDLDCFYWTTERCNFLYSRSSWGFEIVFLISPDSNNFVRSKLNRYWYSSNFLCSSSVKGFWSSSIRALVSISKLSRTDSSPSTISTIFSSTISLSGASSIRF